MGVKVSSPSVFDSFPVGAIILGMLSVGSLGTLSVFHLWIFLEGGCLLFKHYCPLGGRFTIVIVCLGMLAPL